MTGKQKLIEAELCELLSDNQAAYRALNESQFVPFFQPLVTLRTGQLAGFEVLARWQHPSAGLIPPIKFIPMAEQGGWIDALTEQILKKAFAVASVIPDPLTLAINVSPFQLRNLQLPEQIYSMAKKAGFPIHRLVVEITESALIEDLQSAVTIVAELKRLGCKLALDDFGTGYSSLHHLQSLPFDKLKVDRSFVSSMIEKRDSRKIAAAVVGLGQSLGLTTVAEGIETEEQAEIMLWLGCELGQGYFYGRPMAAEGLAAAIALQREKMAPNHQSAWKKISATKLYVSPTQRLAQLQAVYDGAPVGLAFIDQNLRYLNLNNRLANMNGASVEDHLGSHVGDMIPELFPKVEPYIRRALSGEAICDVELELSTTGETRLASYQPALDEAGEVVGVAVAETDITERKRMEDALTASEAHDRSMVELNPQVLWMMDPQGRNLDVSPRWDKATGIMKPQTTSHEWLKAVHPEDLNATVHSIARFRRSGSPIDVEYRVADGAGGWGWKRSMGSPRFDVSGNIVCWYGTVQNIAGPSNAAGDAPAKAGKAASVARTIHVVNSSTESREEERRHQALLEMEILDTPAEAEFDDLVALTSEVCATPISLVSLIDADRQWFKASIGLAESEAPIRFSFCAHAIKQQGLFLVTDAAKDERFKGNPFVVGGPKIRFYAGMPLYTSEGIAVGALCVMDTKPRSLSPIQTKALAILSHQVQARMELRSERRKLLLAITANRDLTAKLKTNKQSLRDANFQLERITTTDSLTGLLNRGTLEERLGVEFADASHKQIPLSILVMDIDNFKNRKTELGHAAGDAALRHVGDVLRTVLRVGDSAARTGGKEFVIVIPDATLDQARIVAGRVQELLGLGDGEHPHVSLSIGIACLKETTKDWEALLAQAHRAMHEAKQAGKNRVVLYEAQNVA